MMLWEESGLVYRGAIAAFAGGFAAMRTVSKVDVTAETGTWLLPVNAVYTSKL